jgi:hypothetical protein
MLFLSTIKHVPRHRHQAQRLAVASLVGSSARCILHRSWWLGASPLVSGDRPTGRRVGEKVDFLFALDALEVCICTSTNAGRSFGEEGEMICSERRGERKLHACMHDSRAIDRFGADVHGCGFSRWFRRVGAGEGEQEQSGVSCAR